MARNYRDRDLKLLWGLAAARCSFPSCRIVCVIAASPDDPQAIIGEIAHIVAHSPDGPRGNPEFPESEIDKYDNLILLCPNHHAQVDAQAATFATEDLRQWKREHELWILERTGDAIPGVGYHELEVVCAGLMSAPAAVTEILSLAYPAAKIERNELQRSAFLVSMALAKAREVHEYVEHVAIRDPDFPERLKQSFLVEYELQRSEGATGDALFEALRVRASGASNDFRRNAAGLVVLVYLFERCEIFEQ